MVGCRAIGSGDTEALPVKKEWGRAPQRDNWNMFVDFCGCLLSPNIVVYEKIECF